mgnify:CR=1 FL=1
MPKRDEGLLAERATYKAFHMVSTRWADNDQYGHINNAKFYEFVDSAVNAHLIEHGALTYDPSSRETTLAGQPVDLSRREQSLLQALLHNRGRVLSTEQLKDSVYGFNDELESNALMLGGIVILGIGSGMYIGAGLGPGPRDGLFTGLAQRGIKVSRARTIVEGLLLFHRQDFLFHLQFLQESSVSDCE